MTVHDVVRLLELVENALPGLETQREEGLWRRWDALTAYVQAERRTKATLELAEEVAQYIHCLLYTSYGSGSDEIEKHHL